MTEAAPVAEQQPTPETSVLQQHTLHARLLYAPACNPAERGSPVPTEEQLMHADHAFIDGCVRNACGQACLAHTPEYTAQNTYEQVLADWKQELVDKMRQQCNVETEQGRKAIEAYQRLGIRVDAFDMEAAQQVYEQFLLSG